MALTSASEPCLISRRQPKGPTLSAFAKCGPLAFQPSQAVHAQEDGSLIVKSEETDGMLQRARGNDGPGTGLDRRTTLNPLGLRARPQ